MANFESTIVVKFDDEQMLLMKRLLKAIERFEEIVEEMTEEEIEAYAEKIFNC